MPEVQSKPLSLFFYFAFLDEQVAFELILKAKSILRRRIKKVKTLNKNSRAAILINTTQQIWQKFSTQKYRAKVNLDLEAGWLPPEGVDLGPWKQFRKEAEPEEFLRTASHRSD